MHRVGSGERLVDGLVGIAHAHPVPAGAGEQPQDLLLKPAAILGLVLQDKRPAIAQPLQELPVQLQRPQRQADEVIEVDRATIGQRPLIIGVDSAAHLGQRERQQKPVQSIDELGRRPLEVLGLADEAARDVGRHTGPLATAHPLALPLL